MGYRHTTWYRLVDGTQADPNEVSPGADGVLRHKNGIAVALHEDGTPMSVGVDSTEGGNAAAAAAADAPEVAAPEPAPAEAPEPEPASAPKAKAPKAKAPKAREMKPAAGEKPYKTRQAKAN